MELQIIFQRLKKIMDGYAPPLTVTTSTESRYDLWSKKKVTWLGRKYPEFYFGGLVLKPKYVAFYLMPVYIFPELLEQMPEHLEKCMTGKSCFHFKTADEKIIIDLENLIKSSFAIYKKKDFLVSSE